jgi:hypothetical protein
MDPTGVALIFGGLVSLFWGLKFQLRKPTQGPWPTPGPRSYDRIQPRWCYWLGLGLIVAGILW